MDRAYDVVVVNHLYDLSGMKYNGQKHVITDGPCIVKQGKSESCLKTLNVCIICFVEAIWIVQSIVYDVCVGQF